MTNKDYTPAIAVKLYIGDIEFDAIKVLATGEYRMSGRQILLAVGQNDNWFSRLGKKGGLSFETLDSMDLSILRDCGIKVEYYKNENITRAESRSLDQADACWEYFSELGNQTAKTILRALRRDSLRDRFDQVHGKDRITVEERREQDNRVMNAPRPSHPLFGDENMDKVADFLKVGRGHIKLALWMWCYIYCTLTDEEIAALDAVNPVQANGHRKQCIHQWLDENATEAHKEHFDEMLTLIKLSNTEQQFIDLFARLNGKFQQKLLS